MDGQGMKAMQYSKFEGKPLNVVADNIRKHGISDYDLPEVLIILLNAVHDAKAQFSSVDAVSKNWLIDTLGGNQDAHGLNSAQETAKE